MRTSDLLARLKTLKVPHRFWSGIADIFEEAGLSGAEAAKGVPSATDAPKARKRRYTRKSAVPARTSTKRRARKAAQSE